MSPAARPDARQRSPLLRWWRRLGTSAGWAATGLAFLALAAAMLWILQVVVVRGAGALTPSIFTGVTQGNGGGLLNAIEGTAVTSLGALLLAVPCGLAAGIYVAEYRHSGWAAVIRFLSDILVGVPSIVMGYAGYVMMVVGLGWHFSVAAAAITLAVIALPYICRTTELALRQVSMRLREAGYALGGADAAVILRIALPSALPGVLTGILLALSISVGETAPLLYTAGWSDYLWNGQLTNAPIGYLTYAIWTFINEPSVQANRLAYAAALLVTGIVLVINIAARLVLRGAQPARV
ncbi:MAG TPA: phosphate ABC transporter permease PstA [Caulobacteraceae bacterium]|nr:phosphate ABC transporter permease PstA [Caulobacteraceae bacterium]